MGRITDWFMGRPLKRTLGADVSGLLEYTVPEWYRDNGLDGASSNGNARLAERVWVANRCQQMNAQQIATMPVEWHGPEGQSEPAWVSSPDPNWYPNGVGDAIHSMVEQIYGWGFVCLHVTSRYVTGFPRTWTVLNSCDVSIENDGGARAYKIGDAELDSFDIVQIDRNPGGRLHGTSALKAYGTVALGLMAADLQARAVNSGAYPTVYLQPKRPITADQAKKLQAEWMNRTAERGGAPPVVPPDITVAELAIDPESLALLDSRSFGVRAICTAYGVPSVLLNQSLQGGLTYQNPGAVGEAWWRFELRPMATRIADALSNQLLPRGQYVSFAADDTFAPLTAASSADDEQAAHEGTPQPTALLPTPGPTQGAN